MVVQEAGKQSYSRDDEGVRPWSLRYLADTPSQRQTPIGAELAARQPLQPEPKGSRRGQRGGGPDRRPFQRRQCASRAEAAAPINAARHRGTPAAAVSTSVSASRALEVVASDDQVNAAVGSLDDAPNQSNLLAND